MSHIEICLGGLGGQGIIKAAHILGEAASLYDRKEVVQTASYGPESRGSDCKAEVIISDQAIKYPFILEPDILVALSNDAFLKYSQSLKEGGLVIVDSNLVQARRIKRDIRVFRIPASNLANQVLNNPLVTNMVILGALTAITQVVSPEAMRQAIARTFPQALEPNLRAFDEGVNLGREALDS